MPTDMSTFAGEMRERICVQEEVDTPDGAGGSITTWKSLTWLFAEVRPVSSMTRIQAMEQALEISHRVTIRYLHYLDMPGTSRYRLLWKGQEMKISGITNPDMRRRFLVIDCVLGQMVAA